MNMTKKYTVASLTILSRIVGILDRPKPPGLRLTQTTIRNARRSVNVETTRNEGDGGGVRFTVNE